MNILNESKFFLLLATTIILSSCSNGSLQSNEDLKKAESFLQKTAQDIKVVQFAELELIKAGNTLKAAAQAESEEQLATLVYMANNQINTAIKIAEIKLSKQKISDANTLRLNLRSGQQQQK